MEQLCGTASPPMGCSSARHLQAHHREKMILPQRWEHVAEGNDKDSIAKRRAGWIRRTRFRADARPPDARAGPSPAPGVTSGAP